MKIDTRVPLSNYDGTSLTQANGKGESKPLTIRDCFMHALNTPIPGERLDPAKKLQLYAISVKIFSNEEVEFTDEEIKIIEQRVALCWDQPVVLGRTVELFTKPVTEEPKAAQAQAPEQKG